MSASEVPLIEHSARMTRLWLEELAEELGRPHDQRYALRVLRGFLHTLRDRLPIQETAHFGAQLPETLRGIYYEQWRPSTQPHRYHDLEGFLSRLADAAQLAGDTEAALAAEATARVITRHVTPDELTKVGAALPREIANLMRVTTPER